MNTKTTAQQIGKARQTLQQLPAGSPLRPRYERLINQLKAKLAKES